MRIESRYSQYVFKNMTQKSEDVFLYYWDKEMEGWWFGSEVGGSLVWCYSTGKGFPPPRKGWRVPIEGDPEIEGLRVIQEETQKTSKEEPQKTSNANGSTASSNQTTRPMQRDVRFKRNQEDQPDGHNWGGM